MNDAELWSRYTAHLYTNESLGLAVDISRMGFDDAFLAAMTPRMHKAFEAMRALEAGAIANPDEKRMVGHYWLRNASLAPGADVRAAIGDTLARIKAFASDVHNGVVFPPKGRLFHSVLVVGIGGSALGPQFVANALGQANDRMRVFFVDNTDPDGIDRTLSTISHRAPGGLDATLVVVISKSGGTKETRNGMLEAERAFTHAGYDFAAHAVAVTGDGSELYQYAKSHNWLATFPMWDWVGGRTSELSAVGLLPAALQGIDIDAILEGARDTDEATRVAEVSNNPAALMALMWFHAGGGKGAKDMVVLPYKDRLELFSRYLQQLVMESLGKEHDLDGKVVEQGIAVYGNKGSTDQHAYVQQLRDGVPNFFVTFIEVLRDRDGESLAVEPGVTAGDYLLGFLEGTRKALYDKGRPSITVTVRDASARTVGMLIALYERTVGLYASLVNINAYHQPGVEAGKKAATRVIALQAKVIAEAKKHATAVSVEVIAKDINEDDVETVYKILRHVSANPDHGVKGEHALDPRRARFGAS